MDLEGGKRRNRKAHSHESKKRNKTHKKGKSNNILKSWVAFVKKIQKDEKIASYKDAIKRASERKKEWKKGQMGGAGSMSSSSMPTLVTDSSPEPMPSSSDSSMSPAVLSSSDMTGGRRKSRRRSRSRSRSRK